MIHLLTCFQDNIGTYVHLICMRNLLIRGSKSFNNIWVFFFRCLGYQYTVEFEIGTYWKCSHCVGTSFDYRGGKFSAVQLLNTSEAEFPNTSLLTTVSDPKRNASYSKTALGFSLTKHLTTLSTWDRVSFLMKETIVFPDVWATVSLLPSHIPLRLHHEGHGVGEKKENTIRAIAHTFSWLMSDRADGLRKMKRGDYQIIGQTRLHLKVFKSKKNKTLTRELDKNLYNLHGVRHLLTPSHGC